MKNTYPLPIIAQTKNFALVMLPQGKWAYSCAANQPKSRVGDPQVIARLHIKAITEEAKKFIFNADKLYLMLSLSAPNGDVGSEAMLRVSYLDQKIIELTEPDEKTIRQYTLLERCERWLKHYTTPSVGLPALAV